MTAVLNGTELTPAMLAAWGAAAAIEWPTDEELTACMLEDCPTESAPRRNRDHSAAQLMTPMEIVRQSRKQWVADLQLQIAALDRLAAKCDALRWPTYLRPRMYDNGYEADDPGLWCGS